MRVPMTTRSRHLERAWLVVFVLILVSGASGCTARAIPDVAVPAAAPALPNAPGSVKFAVLGDFGTGSTRQYETAAMMHKVRGRFPYDFVLTVGDNLYGRQRPRDFVRKFEEPYGPLLDSGVTFHASLGNHDRVHQKDYGPFNMDGQRYYTFTRGPVQFFAIDSTDLTAAQLVWLARELTQSTASWKIAYWHHPLYSSGQRHGSNTDLRRPLEPLLILGSVQVVFTGHEHFYERIVPQHGIQHFIVGSGGQLRRGNIRPGSPLTALGFDTDNSFLLVEATADRLSFEAISRRGHIVDSGTLERTRDSGR
jgi:hypothetical protein